MYFARTDHSILNDEKENKRHDFLENVNLVDTSKANDKLKQKRKLYKGMGHAGGYVSHNDDEFKELLRAQASMAAMAQVLP